MSMRSLSVSVFNTVSTPNGRLTLHSDFNGMEGTFRMGRSERVHVPCNPRRGGLFGQAHPRSAGMAEGRSYIGRMHPLPQKHATATGPPQKGKPCPVHYYHWHWHLIGIAFRFHWRCKSAAKKRAQNARIKMRMRYLRLGNDCQSRPEGYQRGIDKIASSMAGCSNTTAISPSFVFENRKRNACATEQVSIAAPTVFD